MKREDRGRYFHSKREYENACGKVFLGGPCIHRTGSVTGMRKLFWGYRCDVVRVGNWIYKVN